MLKPEYQDPALFVALDEIAVDDKTFQRRYGRSLDGTPCVNRAAFLRGVRHSILPMLTVDGITAVTIIEGSITKEIFLQFLREQVVRLHRCTRSCPN